jgi:hypothetical protein
VGVAHNAPTSSTARTPPLCRTVIPAPVLSVCSSPVTCVSVHPVSSTSSQSVAVVRAVHYQTFLTSGAGCGDVTTLTSQGVTLGQ